jgi:hypothetical protein
MRLALLRGYFLLREAHYVLLRAIATFCHCEPDCVSSQAWQSLYFKKFVLPIFSFKNEIATPSAEQKARNDRLPSKNRLPRLPIGRFASMGIGFNMLFFSSSYINPIH